MLTLVVYIHTYIDANREDQSEVTRDRSKFS